MYQADTRSRLLHVTSCNSYQLSITLVRQYLSVTPDSTVEL